MSPVAIAVIIVAVLILVGIAVTVMRSRSRQRLQKDFGPEYERAVRDSDGDRLKAESALLKREKRVEKFDIRPLPAEQRARFADEWQQVQAKFVDDPERSIALADALVGEVMKARGYPVDDFDQRAADLSVEHPGVVESYRAAHEITVRHSHGKGGTEDLRNAMIGYRSLFEELLRADSPEMAH